MRQSTVDHAKMVRPSSVRAALAGKFTAGHQPKVAPQQINAMTTTQPTNRGDLALPSAAPPSDIVHYDNFVSSEESESLLNLLDGISEHDDDLPDNEDEQVAAGWQVEGYERRRRELGAAAPEACARCATSAGARAGCDIAGACAVLRAPERELCCERRSAS